MRDIKEFSLTELQDILSSWNQPPFHARQVFSWIYKRGVYDFQQMSDLSAGLRQRLKENFYIQSMKLAKSLASKDGTEKFLLELSDGNVIEAVAIPAEGRVTGCLSTQAGCKFACKFCASGLSGFKRDLSSAEIIEEALYLKSNSKEQKLTHLVFMGTGEPLDNYGCVIKAIRMINSPDTLNIGARRITISTCGIPQAINKLSREGLQIELSVSLHAVDDKARSQIMPINKIYPLKTLLAACREYIKNTDRQITFEYILIKGLNSDLPNAEKLSRILKGLELCKVNLIPANSVKELGIEPASKPEILLFRDYLLKQGINVTLRKPRGQDIEAACGQLRLKYDNK